MKAGIIIVAGLMLLVTTASGQTGPFVKILEIDSSRFPVISLKVRFSQTKDSFKTFSPDDIQLWEFGLPMNFTLSCSSEPVAVMLVLDRSGSMAYRPNKWEWDPDSVRWRSAKSALATYVGLMNDNDLAAILTFNHQVLLVESFTSRKDLLIESINSIRVEGGTALWSAAAMGANLLSSRPERRVMILLTDGGDNASGPNMSMMVALNAAQQHKVQVFTIGFSEEVTKASLDSLATFTGGRFYFTVEGKDLAAIYTEISRRLETTCTLEYTSPVRCKNGITHPIHLEYNNSFGMATADTNFTAPLRPWEFSLGLPPLLRIRPDDEFSLPVMLDLRMDPEDVAVNLVLRYDTTQLRFLDSEQMHPAAQARIRDSAGLIQISGVISPPSTMHFPLCSLRFKPVTSSTSFSSNLTWQSVSLGGFCPITPLGVLGSVVLLEVPCDRIVKPRTTTAITDVYPNPADSWITVGYRLHPELKSHEGELQLRDSFGRLLYQVPLQGRQGWTTIPVDHVPSGSYMILLLHSGGTEQAGFFVTR